MQHAKWGKFDWQVSRLSFGASALGGAFRSIDESEGIQAVHAALDAGINYIDVAPAYGATRAETVLGMALKGVKRDRYHISTKVGKLTDPEAYGNNTFDYSRQGIRDSLEKSMRRTGVDYFDIVHLHDFDYDHRIHADEALSQGVEALLELKSEGTIGGIGAGIYPMDLWKRVLLEADVDAVLIRNQHCLTDIRIHELLPLAKAKGVGVINASPFASSFLTGRPLPAWHPAEETESELVTKAVSFCEKNGTTLAKLALQFSSQHPEIPTTLFSSARPESIARNLQWYQEPYDPELVARVQQILEPVMNKQWDYDAAAEKLKEKINHDTD